MSIRLISEANDKEAPKDQLAREWDNLVLKANQEHAKPILLYVTADFTAFIVQLSVSAILLKVKNNKQR
jgi:hypothetical protein